MSWEERAVHINEIWNTRQVREASCQLVYHSRGVLETFIHSLQEVDPDLHDLKATRAVYDAFDLRNVPSEKRFRWDRSEMWVLRFFSDLSFRYTLASLDKRIIQAREAVEAFDSVQDALNYWEDELAYMDQRLAGLEEGSGSTLRMIDASYVDSRVLRFAAHGVHLVRPGAFTFVEN